MRLDGKVIVVTGAGRGLGEGIVEALAEEGARLVVGDLSAPAGTDHLAVAMDVTDPRAIAAGVERAVKAFGRIDGWVDNAGVVHLAPALELSAREWGAEFAVNTGAVFACCQAAARQMIAQGGGGSIVNIASNAGKVGYPNMAAYNASKAAVINLTRSLAAEWAAAGINVNCVCPGGVDTPMLASVADWIAARTGDDPAQLLATMTPAQLGRHIQPIEVGRVVAFLLSADATIVRGQAVNVDAGDTPY